MGEETAISWCDHTFNPWTGCAKVSAECDNCYAETTDHRFHGGAHWGPDAPRLFRTDDYWAKPITWNSRAAKNNVRRRVFCASQSDVFEDRPDVVASRARLFALIRETPHLDWLLLTKRPENAAWMVPWAAPDHALGPYPNVWLGTTCGARASLPRIALLRRVAAVVRFVSCEPILEHVTAEDWDKAFELHISDLYGGIHWLIVGDESGHNRRAAQATWVRTAREAALRNGVAFHLKQWNSPPNAGIHSADPRQTSGKIHLPVLDGRQWAEFPK